ncbi:hypothetical protein D915_002499 [Fasciola hepatica]|uniref:Uncharacterized protein n=1 Tax=Fasciola hepatica TaxID=6192 RepID=A0A4E0RCW8_FASHE|nr:hypothetical protein D915_002499 [Fasciola hepatica]
METMERLRIVRTNRPQILPDQYKNEFGEKQADDRPWPRGEVIYAGRGSPMQNTSPNHRNSGFRSRPGPLLTPGFSPYQPHCGPPFRNPGFRPGFRGRRKPSYQRPGGQGRGMCSAWHGSMPYGLQSCGMRTHPAYTNTDDGFIDDTLVSDLSQFRLQGDLGWRDVDSSPYQSDSGSRLAQQTRTLAKDCASTPYLTQSGEPTRPKSVQTRVSERRGTVMSSSISPAATSDASNPVDRLHGLGDQYETTESTSSPEPQDPLDISDLELSNSSLSALRSPADFLTLAWDIIT